jgi:hypothetical protein
MPSTGSATITTTQVTREAGSRCGRSSARTASASWIRRCSVTKVAARKEVSLILTVPKDIDPKLKAPLTEIRFNRTPHFAPVSR